MSMSEDNEFSPASAAAASTVFVRFAGLSTPSRKFHMFACTEHLVPEVTLALRWAGPMVFTVDFPHS